MAQTFVDRVGEHAGHFKAHRRARFNGDGRSPGAGHADIQLGAQDDRRTHDQPEQSSQMLLHGTPPRNESYAGAAGAAGAITSDVERRRTFYSESASERNDVFLRI